MKKKQRQHDPCLITFEGIDGCGKTTQAMLAFRFLSGKGMKVKLLREPGSTKISEQIREILLNRKNSMSDITELLLYEAARSEIVSREIAPFLASGHIVLCDRFYDSTTAYQGYGRKLDIKMVRALHKVATGNIAPDLTLLFDLDLKTAFSRRTQQLDRLESQSKAFFNRVRRGFLEIARKERRRVKVVDAARPVKVIFADVSRILTKKLKIDESISRSN